MRTRVHAADSATDELQNFVRDYGVKDDLSAEEPKLAICESVWLCETIARLCEHCSNIIIGQDG